MYKRQGLHIPDLEDLGGLKPLHEPQPMESGGAGGFAIGNTITPAASAPFGDSAALANLIRDFGTPPGS